MLSDMPRTAFRKLFPKHRPQGLSHFASTFRSGLLENVAIASELEVCQQQGLILIEAGWWQEDPKKEAPCGLEPHLAGASRSPAVEDIPSQRSRHRGAV